MPDLEAATKAPNTFGVVRTAERRGVSATGIVGDQSRLQTLITKVANAGIFFEPQNRKELDAMHAKLEKLLTHCPHNTGVHGNYMSKHILRKFLLLGVGRIEAQARGGKVAPSKTLPLCWRSMPDSLGFWRRLAGSYQSRRICRFSPHIHPLMYSFWTYALHRAFKDTPAAKGWVRRITDSDQCQPLIDTIENMRSESDSTPAIGQACQRVLAGTADDKGGEEEEEEEEAEEEEDD